MNFLSGYKTYIGGVGLMFLGIGDALTGSTSIAQAATQFALGLITVGARSFGQKILDAIKSK